MKYAGTVCGIVALVLCFALMAYAEPTSPAPEDKTEAAKAQAIADAEAKLQPLETNIKIIFDEALKDHQLKWGEMKKLDEAIENYRKESNTADQHLAIYKIPRGQRVYLQAIELDKLYFSRYFFLSDGRHHQKEMRLLAAKEGVDIQVIEINPPLFLALFFLVLGVLSLIAGLEEEILPAFLWGCAFLIMAVVTAASF